MTWRIDDPQGNESAKIKWELVPYTTGRGLDLGCGPFKTFPHFIGVDNGGHDAQFGWKNEANLLVDTCEKMDIIGSASMDFVFSSHLLEHIQDHKKALLEWWRLIKPNGYLCLYLPHKDHYPNVGQKGANPDHKHDFLPQDIIDVMKEVGYWDLVENQERSEGTEYSFFQVYKKIHVHKDNKKHIESWKAPKPEKTCAVVRYGAFGDLIMASSILPGLKEQGYHITLYTTKQGYSVVKHDPHIDKFVIQDNDQVLNHELGLFWEHLAAKYDKFINLSESVEGTLLALPGRIAHTWPKAMREKYLDVNYLEFHHDLAGVSMPSKQAFYATEEERKWAKKERAGMGEDSYVILWSLSGSAVHKAWPWLDQIIARLMITHRNVKVVLVGDELCQLLEAGWENEQRVLCRSGKWSIRESLTFTEYADLVVGPETGVLNAAGLLPVPKVVTLSHSTANNLTKHWKNTTALEPKTSCYPCHQLHYGFDYCRRSADTGVSQCQTDIGPDEMFEAIEHWIDQSKHKEASNG